ncbi:MAG: hypothetical protein NWF05_05555 [Candidatus Bathyarchaeota archaeon]|nr:hypothetical protein [Candidatus Bathyarchaeota archaeon]
MMSKNLKILILLAILLAASALTILLVGYEQQNSPSVFPFSPRSTVTRINPADIELYYVVRMVLSSINIALLIVLMVNYLSIYLKTKSEFTIGLMFFSAFLLIKDVTWSPFVIGWFGFGLLGLGPFAFLPDMFELVALSVLLYMSIEY